MALNRGMRGQAHVAKMRAELEELERMGIQTVGNAFSSILFAKGELGPAEKDGRPLFSGPDGKALRAALLKLGYPPEDWTGMSVSSDPALMRRAVLALDPATLVLCDDAAAAAARDAFADDLFQLADLDDAMLVPGHVVHVAGMRMLNLGGFEAALANDRQKQVVWAYLKRIPPLGEPY